MKKTALLFSSIALLGSTIFVNADVGANFPNTTISFEAGKASLMGSDKAKLKNLIKDARAKGKIDEVYLAAWSDNPVPKEGGELSKVDRRLAGKRLDAVKDYLKHSLKITSDIDTYNMAERSNWLSRTFESPDYELKSGVSKDSPLTKEEFTIIKENGSPSREVVVIKLK